MTPHYKPIPVETIEAPELEPYRTLRRPLEHEKQGIFIAEGEKVVRRLLQSTWTVLSLLMTPAWFKELESITPQFTEEIVPVYIAERKVLESIVGYRLHQGIMAVGRLPQSRTEEQWIRDLPKPHLIVALDGIVHAENVGVIVRNCAGLGVDALVAGQTSSSPFLRRAVRNSMGAIFSMNTLHANYLASTLRNLAQTYGTRIVAADPQGLVSIYNADFTANVCLVFGNEGSGISSQVLELCESRVSIPMMKQTDSLNVSSACAVMLYEAARQRSFQGE